MWIEVKNTGIGTYRIAITKHFGKNSLPAGMRWKKLRNVFLQQMARVRLREKHW